MAKNQESDEKRGRGRPAVDTDPVTVRLPRDVLDAIDAARRDIATIPTRPDILRMATTEWLKIKGYLK